MTLGAGRDHESEATGAIGGGGGRKDSGGQAENEAKEVAARKSIKRGDKRRKLGLRNRELRKERGDNRRKREKEVNSELEQLWELFPSPCGDLLDVQLSESLWGAAQPGERPASAGG